MNQRRHSYSRQNGFTLVELLVYFGLFAILLTIITNIFIYALEKRVNIETVSLVQQESQYVLAKLKYDVYNAESVTIPASFGESSQQLELQSDGETRSYSLSNGRLGLTVDGEPEFLTSGHIAVSNLVFTNQSLDSSSQTVEVSFDIIGNEVNGQQPVTRTVSTILSTR